MNLGRTRLRAAVIVALLVSGVHAAIALDQPQSPPMQEASVKTPTGIIILGGGLHNYLVDERRHMRATGPGERIATAIELAKKYPTAIVLYTGFEGMPGPYPALQRGGIAKNRIIYEDQSKTTAENARFSVKAVNPKKDDQWLLVTSAYHMPRALACFQAAGFNVKPFPVETESTKAQSEKQHWHEVFGSLGYKLMNSCGRDDAPRQ